MKELTEQEIRELAEKKLQGTSYSEIRSQLDNQGFSDEQIRTAIRKVDEVVLKVERENSSLRKAGSWYWAGVALAGAGLLLTFGRSYGYFAAGIPRWLAYAPFFTGILLMYYGRRKRARKAGKK